MKNRDLASTMVLNDFDVITDRVSFIAWTEGVMFERTRTTMVVGDTLENREVEKILKRGGTVLLTVRGKPFSTLCLDKKKGEYVETLLKNQEKTKKGKEACP